MRRDSNDPQWKAVKKEVELRDGNKDRFVACLSARQASYFFEKNKNNSYIRTLDPAHVLPVSKHPSIMYKACNILTINRIAHEALDHSRSPITGEVISSDRIKNWWKLILGRDQYLELIHYKPAMNYFNDCRFIDTPYI